MIGIPHIDEAHRSLFAAAERLRYIIIDDQDSRNRRACMDMIKFMEHHLFEHFRDEEEFMRTHNCPNYEYHKMRHQLIQESLEEIMADVELSGYSSSAIKRLIGSGVAQLLYHTCEIDSAILKDKPNIDITNDAAVAMEKAIRNIARDVFDLPVELTRNDSDAERYGDEIYGSVVYCHRDGRRFHVVTGSSQHCLLASMSRLFNIRMRVLDEMAISAIDEMSRLIGLHFLRNYQNGDFFSIEESVFTISENGHNINHPEPPLCSLLFDGLYGVMVARAWKLPDRVDEEPVSEMNAPPTVEPDPLGEDVAPDPLVNPAAYAFPEE
jgi:hemerythrin